MSKPVFEKIESGLKTISGQVKNSGIWNWLKKWGSIAAGITVVIAVLVIISLGSFKHYSGNCAGVTVIKDRTTALRYMDSCDHDSRRDDIKYLKDNSLLDESWASTDILNYIDKKIIKGSSIDTSADKPKKGWFK